MQSSDVPVRILTAWAADAAAGNIDTIPQSTGVLGRASWEKGYPPENFIPPPAGGVPPFGQDQNGSLNAISAWIRWIDAGGPITYDATFSATVGGYPKGALLSGLAAGDWWLNLVENNPTNPDAGGANWEHRGGTRTPVTTATGTANAIVVVTVPPTLVLTDGETVGILATATNTGNTTIDTGAGARPALNVKGQVLSEGDIANGQIFYATYNLLLDAQIISSTVPSQLVGAGVGPDGLGGLTLNYTALPTDTNPAIGAILAVFNPSTGEYEQTTAGAVAGLAGLSDAIQSEIYFAMMGG